MKEPHGEEMEARADLLRKYGDERGVDFVTPNNEYYRNKNLGFGWAIKHENETEITWGESGETI